MVCLFLRLLLRRQPGANDLVNYTSSWFSLLYGLLLGLLSVTTYQNHTHIQAFVQREAAALALLYRDSTAYPEPLRSELQYRLSPASSRMDDCYNTAKRFSASNLVRPIKDGSVEPFPCFGVSSNDKAPRQASTFLPGEECFLITRVQVPAGFAAACLLPGG